MSQPTAAQPAPEHDRCPYPRPFPEGFSECPAFQPQQFVAATTHEQPLGTHLSCTHLRVGERAHNRFYAQCAIGTAADRRAWVQRIGEARVEMMRRLSVEFETKHPGLAEALAAAKAAALAAPDDPAARRALDDALGRVSAAAGDFVTGHAVEYEALGFPVASLMELLDQALTAWRESPRLGTPEIDAEQLAKFAPDLRTFLGGTLAGSRR
jgi:hypothetical protein